MPCALCPFTAASSSDERAAVPTPGTALWTWLLRQSWIFFFFPLYSLKCQGWELCAGVRCLLSVYRIPAAAAWNLL